MPRADPLSSTFAALADPTRRAMLARLALGEMSVNELAKPFKMSGPAVSKHLKVLERAGLITRGRAAQRRPCRLAPAGLQGVDDWLAGYRRLWAERLDRLDDYLSALQAKSGQAKSGQAKSGQAKSGQAKSGQAKTGKTAAPQFSKPPRGTKG